MSRLRAWLDTSVLSDLALAVMRDATGRDDPVARLRPTRPAALGPGRRVGFWSLVGGVGTSTTAALLAHRSAAAGRAPLLVDLDRWAPALALRAKLEAATIADVLVQPGRERALVSRWASVPFVPGSPHLRGEFDADRVLAAIDAMCLGGPVVLDLGTGVNALDVAITSRLDRLCVVCGASSSQLQAVFCSLPLLRDQPCPTGLVVVGVDDADARMIGERTGLTLLASIPRDPYLSTDEFAARAPTLRALDVLIRALA